MNFTTRYGTRNVCTQISTSIAPSESLCRDSGGQFALKVALGHLLVATWWFSGREQSSVNAHLSSRVRRHGTSYGAPSATLFIREQFQDGSENISVCISYLTVHYIFIAAFTVSLVLVCGLYGALDDVTAP